MLSPEQLQLVEALVSSGTIKAACRKVGTPIRTAHDWRRLPEFAAALDLARTEAFKEAVGRLKGLAAAAVGTLKRKLRSKDDAVAVRAAVALLRQATSAVELGDLLARIEALEHASTPRRPAYLAGAN